MSHAISAYDRFGYKHTQSSIRRAKAHNCISSHHRPPTARCPAGAAAQQALARRLPLFTSMLERLVQAGDFREAVLLADCLLLLARQLPPGGAAVVSEAAAALCEQQEPEVCHAPAARALLELLVRCSGAGQDAQLLQQVAQDLQRAVGSADDTQLTGSETMPLLAGDRNIQAAASFVAAYCDEGLAEMDKVGCVGVWGGGLWVCGWMCQESAVPICLLYLRLSQPCHHAPA